MWTVVAVAGQKVMLQLVAPVSGSVHEAGEPKSPPRSDEKLTDPEGRAAVPASLSETVAVQVV